jgi:hypothetical protein
MTSAHAPVPADAGLLNIAGRVPERPEAIPSQGGLRHAEENHTPHVIPPSFTSVPVRYPRGICPLPLPVTNLTPAEQARSIRASAVARYVNGSLREAELHKAIADTQWAYESQDDVA